MNAHMRGCHDETHWPLAGNEHLERAERHLNKAANASHPMHGVKDALVGIGYAVLHWASTQPKEGR